MKLGGVYWEVYELKEGMGVEMIKLIVEINTWNF